MSENKLGYNQAVKYLAAVADVFYEVLETKKPADRVLRSFFSNNRQCGSKDRRFISEGLYSLFRWYGWLKILLPSEKPQAPADDDGFRKALLICLNLEGMTSSLAYSALCELGHYSNQDFPDELISRMSQVSELVGRELSVEDLVPEWFAAVSRDLDIHFFEALQKRPPVWVRIQNGAHDAVLKEFEEQGLDLQVSEKVSNACKLTGKVNLTTFRSYRKGLFEIQDLASQVLVEVCKVTPGQSWWDVCAGGGGKTLAIADKLAGKGRVIATDKRKEVLQEVKKRSQRAGFRNVILANLHKEKTSEVEYDGVLVDAPCSCTGTWRRNPDAKWTREENVCQKWAKIQLQILSEACGKVKDGGVLVYATCSSSFIENEEVVALFLETNEEFQLDLIEHPLTGEAGAGMIKVDALPEDCDSMFAARMIRKKKPALI